MVSEPKFPAIRCPGDFLLRSRAALRSVDWIISSHAASCSFTEIERLCFSRDPVYEIDTVFGGVASFGDPSAVFRIVASSHRIVARRDRQISILRYFAVYDSNSFADQPKHTREALLDQSVQAIKSRGQRSKAASREDNLVY